MKKPEHIKHIGDLLEIDDTDYSSACYKFKSNRASIAEGRVKSMAVREDFNVLKNI